MPRLRPILAAVLFAAACSPANEAPGGSASSGAAEKASRPRDAASDPSKVADVIARGQAVYMANCTVCHNPDPNQAGGLGPEVAHASRELLDAKVLRSEYPAGYTPVRDTKVMVALPHLEPDLDALAAFLADTVHQ